MEGTRALHSMGSASISITFVITQTLLGQELKRAPRQVPVFNEKAYLKKVLKLRAHSHLVLTAKNQYVATKVKA